MFNFPHPFIITLNYAFQDAHRLYQVTEYCSGGSMQQLIYKQKERLTEDEARLYIAQIVLAIGHLHKHGILYKDLNVDRVMVDEQGNAKLLDFSINHFFYGNKNQNYNMSFDIPIVYSSPELIKGRQLTYSHDWYSIGVLLYEMIVRIPPYYNNNRKLCLDNIK